ncbi:GNAT family N-acetyltransferase [Glycomyces paridis]|uniref:GNAT family N-acetyltransferase n=1 Tax=Glycomyces paridis TaxID=2126555 RepID=A0A4S8PIW8_9ACTN|nr:GNAT family N-acetyltransferase [Glycomyces paridis]THV30617.1 GNAT family N-acetyltransferase [Glycomyces paridis]
MRIIEFDKARPDLIDRTFALLTAAHEADTPENPEPVERFYKTMFTHLFPGRRKHWFAAVETGDDGEEHVIGLGRVNFFLDENQDFATFAVTVHPGHRRRGHGAALLAHVERFCAEQGRTTVVTAVPMYWENGPERDETGARALERRGYTRALTTVNRRSPAAPFGADEETRRYDEARAKAGDAYELRQWAGPVPDDLLITMCRMETMIMSEIPLGELDLQPEQVDAKKLRGREAVNAAEGRVNVHSVAVDRSTGEVVAWTEIGVDEGDHADGHQGITIVDPAHRGHRLGLLLKLANLRQLRERFPHVAWIWTDNADVNAPMIAINELLGYATVDANAEYQRKLEAPSA